MRTLSLLVLAATMASAQIPTGAVLDGLQSVPPNASVATGVAFFHLNLPTQTVTYRVEVTGVSGTMAHIHTGGVGQTGGVLVPLSGGPTIWEGTSAPLTNSQVVSLLKEGLYVNVHSAAFPNGEIRGQITPVVRRTLVGALSGSQENPPVVTGATGAVTLHLNQPFGTLDYDVVTSGLTGTMAHIHNGPIGMNGPVVFPLQGGPTRWSGTVASVSASEQQALLSGARYVNVHTTANPGGELRSQVNLPTDSRFVAVLSAGDANTPSAGTGLATFLLDENTGILTYTVDVSGLSGTVTVAHLHNGVLRENGGVAVDLNPPVGASSWSGSATMTTTQMNTLRRYGLYTNVHTTAFGGGEIRGQVLPNPHKVGFPFRDSTPIVRTDALHGAPAQGLDLTITLTGAPAGATCDLYVSSSIETLFGQPLPLVTPVGNVWIDATLLQFFGTTADSNGHASLTFGLPAVASLRGFLIYGQWLVSDAGGPIRLSEALRVIVP